MPNPIAHLVFYMWPFVVYMMFRRLDLVPAIIWSMILGYLFIPARMQIDLPAVPSITKYELTTIAVFACIWLKKRADAHANRWRSISEPSKQHVPERKSRARILVLALLTGIIMAAILTMMTNGDPLFYGPTYLPGLGLYDLFSIIGGLIFMLLPFWIGLRYVNSADSHVAVLRIFCVVLAGYSLLALWEVRMSPQLNFQIYGFRASAFLQHIRAGGFRPMVFLDHGLSLGILLAMCVLAAAALWRHMREAGRNAAIWLICAFWLLSTLILAKSVGALIIAVILLPVVMFAGRRTQLLVSAVLAGIVVLYPMLRGSGMIPTEQIYEIAQSYSADRAQSLGFRLRNEDNLLEKANERPIFGWGSWGRNHIYDPTTGRMLSVTDGSWIIFIGVFGWVGYIASFGTLTAGIILFAIKRRRLDITFATAGIAIVLAGNLVDLLPNSSLRPITWMLAGGLAGRFIAMREGEKLPEAVRDTPDVALNKSALKVRKPRSYDKLAPPMTLPDLQPVPADGSLKTRKRR